MSCCIPLYRHTGRPQSKFSRQGAIACAIFLIGARARMVITFCGGSVLTRVLSPQEERKRRRGGG